MSFSFWLPASVGGARCGFAFALFAALAVAWLPAAAATPGTVVLGEDFTTTTLGDAAQTTANWSTREGALTLAWERKRYEAFDPDIAAGTDITTDGDNTGSVALGDLEGDGDLNLVAGTLEWTVVE